MLSSLVDTTYHVTASAPRRTSFQAIPKAVPYILQVAATTVAAVADISHNPEIRHAILHGQPIYDNHPAFDDFYNSCRTVNNINADIQCSAPTFNYLLCNSPTPKKLYRFRQVSPELWTTNKQTKNQRSTKGNWQRCQQKHSHTNKEVSIMTLF